MSMSTEQHLWPYNTVNNRIDHECAEYRDYLGGLSWTWPQGEGRLSDISDKLAQGPLLLTWSNFNPTMDK